MKTISIAEFNAALSNLNQWAFEQTITFSSNQTLRRERWNSDTDEPENYDVVENYGYAKKTATFDGITITYNEGYSYCDCDADSLSTSTQDLNFIWELNGITLIDDDGDTVSDDQLADYLPENFTDKMTDIDYSAIIGNLSPVTDVDYQENSAMETFIIESDNAPSIRFSGELIASTSSSANNTSSYYSGQTGRWTTLALYKTIGGKFICQTVGHTQWANEKTRYSAAVCADEAEVIKFFGHRWLAKALYAEAGIIDCIDVE